MSVLSVSAGAQQTGSWPLTDHEMKTEQKPYGNLPDVVQVYGFATVKGHLVNGYQMPDTVSLRYFMGTDIKVGAKVDGNGDFMFRVPVARTCGAFIDNRSYVFLTPNDTLEVWLSQKSPLLKTERRLFARGPLASLICDLNNARSQSDVLREHLMMASSDIMEYMTMEKSVTDLLKTVQNYSGDIPSLVKDELILVCRHPKITYSRYFPDILALVKRYQILTGTRFSQEVRFSNLATMLHRGETFDKKELDNLPEAYREYLLYCR